MRLTILAVGSTGDVRPCLALANRLGAAGYRVRLAVPSGFEMLTLARGIELFPLTGDPRAILQRDEGKAWLATGKNPATLVRRLLRAAQPELQAMLDDLWAASQGADLLIYQVLIAPIGQTIAQARGIPSVLQSNYPASPTAEFTPFYVPDFPYLGRRVERAYNRAASELAWPLICGLMRSSLNRWRRRTLGLAPVPLWGIGRSLPRPALTLYGYSPHLLPPPPDWDPTITVTGYWFLPPDPAWQPPADLVAFLAAGPPPVAIGFGSMVAHDPQATLATVLAALARTGQRGLLLRGWGGLAQAPLPSSVYLADEVPHDWLFPQVTAALHHAGAGTTHASLAAGLPTIAAPFFADQHLWARRIAELGVGPAPIPQADFTVERVSAAIAQAVGDGTMRARARALGVQLQAEPGLDAAVDAIQHLARTNFLANPG